MAHSNEDESLIELARRLAIQGPVKTYPTPRRIRILFNGAIIADTLACSNSPSSTATGSPPQALYVWEHERYPQFYLPMEAFVQPPNFTVRLEPGDSIEDTDSHPSIHASTTSSTNHNDFPQPEGQIIGGTLILSVKPSTSPDSDFKHLTSMVLFAADLTGPGKELCNMVKVSFDAVDQWFEEDTPITVHPKDPFKRIDILASTRPIRFLVSDVVVATSTFAMHLYETGLPVRYYIPLAMVDHSLLRASTSKSLCPYKGEAAYKSVVVKGEVYRDLLWGYTTTTPECVGIAGLWCFWNETVDVEFLDEGAGRWRREVRPKSHFV